MSQQTAVDWYYEKTVIQGKTNYYELLEQAKQIEKEQIIDAYLSACVIITPYGSYNEDKQLEFFRAEKYYNETYKK